MSKSNSYRQTLTKRIWTKTVAGRLILRKIHTLEISCSDFNLKPSDFRASAAASKIVLFSGAPRFWTSKYLSMNLGTRRIPLMKIHIWRVGITYTCNKRHCKYHLCPICKGKGVKNKQFTRTYNMAYLIVRKCSLVSLPLLYLDLVVQILWKYGA